jgi:phosphoribosylglycinamide formyltransferase-1
VTRFGVLASGEGTNLQALIDAWQRGEIAGELVVVVANRPGAPALDRARAAGVDAVLLDHRGFGSRAAFDDALAEALAARRVEVVVLAGFMRILSAGFVRRYRGRLVNVHPALLPAFPGLDAQQQALDAGVKLSGCTVHLVDEGVDTGPIVAQAAVPVLADDTEATLSARIRQQEHLLLPRAVDALCRGVVQVRGRQVVVG